MTSAADNHVDHSQGDMWIKWQRNQGGDHPERWSVVSNRVATDRSGGREIREEITQNGDRWSVNEWPPADQFQDKHLGEEREKQ